MWGAQFGQGGEPMRVLRVSERIPPLSGGKEVHVLELTRQQTAAGLDVTTLYRTGDGSLLAGYAHQVRLPRAVRDMGGLPGTSIFGALARQQMRSFADFDVIHLHGDIGEAIAFGRAQRKADQVTVLTVHGSLNSRYRRLSKVGFRGVDHFIALGSAAQADLIGCGVPAELITTMSSGLNFELLHSATAPAKREPGLVVSVGSLIELKNHSTTIQAVRMLQDTVDLRLEIIGSGALEEQLRHQARDLENVSFLGQVSRETAYQRMAAASAFLIASRRQPNVGEGIPTALLEALAAGAPCVVSQDASPAAVVMDRDAYVTFDPDSAADLSDKLRGVLTDPRRAQQLSDRGKSAVRHLGWPDVAAQVDAVYESALRAKNGGQAR